MTGRQTDERVEPPLRMERHLRYLLSNGPGMIYSLDGETYAITYISDNVAALMGYEVPDFLVSGFWLRHVHPEDMQNVERAFATIRAAGSSSYEYRFLHADGTYHWMYDDMSLVPGSGSEPAEIFGVWLDVTQRRQAEEDLRAARERVQRIVAASPTMVYSLQVVGTSVRPAWVSENLQRLLGYTPEESFAKSWWNERVHPEDWGKARAGQLELLRSGEHVQEYRFRHRDGSYRWVREEARVVEWRGGEPVEVVGSWSDVTERRAAEEARLNERKQAEADLRVAKEAAERANRAKSEFLSHMSHELRTPLSSVLGFSELLADGSCGDVNARQAEYLENILSSGRHLLSLINDLLDLVKIEAGRVDLDLVETDLGSLVADITDAVRALAVKAGLRLTLSLADSLPPATVDPRRFKQMLLNLLSNAIKFTPHGGTVEVDLRREESIRPRGMEELAGPWLRVDVVDTGIGIASQDLDGLFQIFEQVRSAQRATQPGTGLGLALTRLLAGMHGGHAWAASAGLHRGSTFSVALPLPSPGGP